MEGFCPVRAGHADHHGKVAHVQVADAVDRGEMLIASEYLAAASSATRRNSFSADGWAE